jgi:hypothetical protein
MSEPLFLIQIVHVGSEVVAKMPGGGRLEADFIDLVVAHIKKKNNGYLVSGAQVEQNVKEGIVDAINSLKARAHFAL